MLSMLGCSGLVLQVPSGCLHWLCGILMIQHALLKLHVYEVWVKGGKLSYIKGPDLGQAVKDSRTATLTTLCRIIVN